MLISFLLFLLHITISCRNILALSSSGNQQKSLSQNLRPTSADIQFEKWCNDNGIVRVGIQTITTPASLGGRGIFATKPLKQGSVVASIPAKLVISSDTNTYEEDESKEEWQVSITNSVMELFDQSISKEEVQHNVWLESWGDTSGLYLEKLFSEVEIKGSEYVYSKHINELSRQIAGHGLITQRGLEKDLKERLVNFERRFTALRHNKALAKWYTLVMSRSAYLGKQWGEGSTGVVPFFDMLNHSHDISKKNVDLMSFGDCFEESVSSKKMGLSRKDLLLVLEKDVDVGEELLTQYDSKVDNEETQLKFWLQYGIPPP